MSVLHAIILGIVQGATEFLPISSTGHLRLIPRLFGWSDAGITFDVALHFGTLLAVISYFWRDWIDVLRPVVNTALRKPHAASPRFGRNLFWGIVIGCVPAGIFGLLLNDTIDRIEQTKSLDTQVMLVVASMLIVVGIIMYACDKYGSKKKKKLAQMCFMDWVAIGFAQAAALVPGVSRSGATISAGLARGMDRDSAARFSFLLSTPIILAAALTHAKDIMHGGIPHNEVTAFIAGVVSSAVVGYITIRFLLGYLRKHSVNVFVWYRLALGVFILLFVAVKM
ncbi:MAG: undecaprenyl-diphosphatase UppP [Armatimonadota bacterium]